ncbi:myosin-10-like isoform X2 [Zootermopsis nevadensis]|uniref:myosin-10-like isoform X2 n=1 Tax=Zootermopsis nevadensis TaxID=136037 RepID=UPI000B8ECF62|nr:myosin-10-like isoform X2 [Zootermopsis nevadensis]
MRKLTFSLCGTSFKRRVKLEKRVRELQEELARKDERLRHYEEELLRARRFEAEDAGPRHKAMEQAVDFRAKECNERKHEMELAEIVQKFNNLETKIDALMKAGSEREEEVTWKDRKLRLYKLELNRRENLETKVQDVFRLLRNKEREFNDLQSQVTLKNLLIERLGAELNSAARELTRRNEINIERDNKIQALEDQLRYYRMKSDRAERDNQPLRCITRMLKQNDACNSYLDYEAKHQDGTTSDKVILMESSTINDRRASSAVSDHVSDEPNGPKGAQLQLKKTDDNLSTNTFAAGRVKNYSLAGCQAKETGKVRQKSLEDLVLANLFAGRRKQRDGWSNR